MTSPRGIKKSKTRPASANMVKLYVGTDHTMFWKGRAQPRRPGAKRPARPRPKKWASLVVFLHDASKRKRSFHVAWNGRRFNDTPEVERMLECEPDLYQAVRRRLPCFNDRLIKNWDDE